MKLGYTNRRRPSKPNLPSVPKPSKLLAPMRLRRTFVFSSLSDLAIRPIASTKPHQLLLVIPQNFPSSKTLSTLWIGVGYVWVQISSQGMTMGEGWRRCYNDFSIRMSSSLSLKMGVCVVENLSRVFLSKWPMLHLWVIRVYIVWVKSKKVTLKNPPGRMFCNYLTGRPYPQDSRKNDSLAQLFSFQLYVPHITLSRVSFSWASHEIHWFFI